MLNPDNYTRSLRQWFYGVAGLPWTFSRMKTGRAGNEGSLLVLCYHRIVGRRRRGGFCDNHLFINLPEKVFIRQIKWLTRRYQVVSLDRVLSGHRLPQRSALITFDDGFTDIYEIARPILNFFRLPATLFLIGSVIRERKIPWITRLHWLLDHAREKGLKLGDPSLPGKNGYPGGYADILAGTKALLKEKDIHEIDEYLSGLEERLGAAPPRELAERRFISDEKIRDLCSMGWTVGNHTDHHLNLASLGHERVCGEIKDAAGALSRFKGCRPVLAVPFGVEGSFSPQTVDAARMCGMEYVFTTCGGPNRFPGSGAVLDRVICETFSSLYFRFLASGGKKAVENALARMRPARRRQ